MAVLLAEQSVYSTVLDENGHRASKPKFQKGLSKKSKLPGGTGPSLEIAPDSKSMLKAKKTHAIARGGRRGSNDPTLDPIYVRDCAKIDEEAADEGLYSLVQSGICRREVLARIYGNKLSS